MYRMLRVMNRHDRAVALIVALASVAAPSDASAQQAPPTTAPTHGRSARVVLSALGGLGLGVGLGLGGVAIGSAISHNHAYPFESLVLGTVGWTVGVPIGVLVVGALRDGNGGAGWTALGALGGVVVTSGVALAIGAGGGDWEAPSLVALPILSVGGAVLAYELSCDAPARPTRTGAAGARWTFTLNGGAGGVTAGAVGTF